MEKPTVIKDNVYEWLALFKSQAEREPFAELFAGLGKKKTVKIVPRPNMHPLQKSQEQLCSSGDLTYFTMSASRWHW